MTIKKLNDYVVVLRAPSAPLIEEDDFLRINLPTENGIGIITFRTRFNDIGIDSTLPGELWIDVRGPSFSMGEAVTLYGNAASGILSVIAFCTNAAIGDIEPELVYDNSPQKSKRDFLQNMLPDEMPILHVRRRVNINVIKAVMRDIENHKEKDRIMRAVAQYNMALRNWRFGKETLATAHMYMGIEALVKAVTRASIESENSNEDVFARKLGIDIEKVKLDPCKHLSTELQAVVRKDIIFKRDYDTHRESKRASDGFEHGFLPFDEIRNHAVKVRDKTALYLREAIINLIGLDESSQKILLTSPFDEPMGHWPVVKYIRGQLVGDSEKLAAENRPYPIFTWKSKISSVDVNDEGEYIARFDDNFTAFFGDGIDFQRHSIEVWKP